jgi:dTDP-4-amino-4,6-dideoxygalactose transaminase
VTISIPLSDVKFGPEEQAAVMRVLESGWVSMGPETARFESDFSRYVGTPHSIAVSSGTAALHLALKALGVGPGDEVIVPSLTFVATANVVRNVGAVPVFADVTDETDWNISPREIERKATSKTKAVIAVHYAGFPCRMDLITEIARNLGIKVIEDAAHAPGGTFAGRKLGTWGDAGCFSFFANKNMTTAEGGMVTTDNDEVARSLRLLRSHGMTLSTWDRRDGSEFSYDVIATGFNHRIDEIRAALGRVQLAQLDRNNARRGEITRRMRSRLAELPQVSFPFAEDDLDSSACHIFPVLLGSASDRPSFMARMRDRGIGTSIHYPPVHLFSAYRDYASDSLPLTESVGAREVTLPLFPGMTEEQEETLVTAVEALLKGG